MKKFYEFKQLFMNKYENDKLQILFFILFLFLITFLILSKSNPYIFLFTPYRLYPISLKIIKKDIIYYSFDRNTNEFIPVKVDLYFSGDLENDIQRLAQIVQQPKSYLRENLKDAKDIIYFPPFSLSIIKVYAEKDKLYLFFEENLLKRENFRTKFSYNFSDSELEKLFYQYEKSLIYTIFENYESFKEIHCNTQNKETIWKSLKK